MQVARAFKHLWERLLLLYILIYANVQKLSVEMLLSLSFNKRQEVELKDLKDVEAHMRGQRGQLNGKRALNN